MPLDQHIEGGHGERQARLQIRPDPVHDLLEVADQREHREHRLHQQAVLPLPAPTQFEVAGIALCSMEGRVTSDHHALFEQPNQPLKGVIRNVRCGTVLPHHQTILVQQQT